MMNWNPPWWVQIYLMIFEIKKFQKFSDHSEIFFCFTIHKKLNKSCSLKKKFCSWKKNLSLKKTLKKKFVSGTHHGGFQCIMILTPSGVTFHPVVVITLGKNLLFKSVLAHSEQQAQNIRRTRCVHKLFLSLFWHSTCSFHELNW